MLPCSDCAYRQSIPGSEHFRCTFDWINADKETRIQIPRTDNPKVLRWFLFPYNYDPLWGPDACPVKADKKDPNKTARSDAFTDLLSLMT